MPLVEFDKHVCASGQVFQHPACHPFVVGDETRHFRLVEAEFGRSFAFLVEPPSHHRIEVGYLKEEEAVQCVEQPSVFGGQRFVDVAPPTTFGIRFGFESVDRCIEPVRRLRARADAPTLEQNDVRGCLHIERFGGTIVQTLVEDRNRYDAVGVKRIQDGLAERNIVGTGRSARCQQGMYAVRQRFAFGTREVEIVDGKRDDAKPEVPAGRDDGAGQRGFPRTLAASEADSPGRTRAPAKGKVRRQYPPVFGDRGIESVKTGARRGIDNERQVGQPEVTRMTTEKMESLIRSILNLERCARNCLTVAGGYISLLVLRLLLGYEYFESGAAKLGGSNWFGRLDFPFPFSLMSTEVNWFMAMWFELIGAVLLIVGFATRYVSLCLIVVTLVAIHAAHLPTDGFGSISDVFDGYRISRSCVDGVCTGNYKLPVIFLIMFIPLALSGGGKLSIDHWLKGRFGA